MLLSVYSSLKKQKGYLNLPGPVWKINSPSLNHEWTAINHIHFQLKFTIFAILLIAARLFVSRILLNRICLMKWNRIKATHHATIERKNRWETKSWKGLERHSWGFGTAVNHGGSHYLQIEKIWSSSALSQECLAFQNYSKSASTTHAGDHKRTQNNIYRTEGLS